MRPSNLMREQLQRNTNEHLEISLLITIRHCDQKK